MLDEQKPEDLHQGTMTNHGIGLLCCVDLRVSARIPLQSPIGSEEPIGDSFSPGEAFG